MEAHCSGLIRQPAVRDRVHHHRDRCAQRRAASEVV